MPTEATVRIHIADLAPVKATLDEAAKVIAILQDALIAERIGWQTAAGLLTVGSAAFTALWDQTREQLRAEGLPMGDERS